MNVYDFTVTAQDGSQVELRKITGNNSAKGEKR